MKRKDAVKILIKEIVREVYRRRGGTSGEHELEGVELENLQIPGITGPEDAVILDIMVEYGADAGEPARGMFGPPEHSSPAVSPSAEPTGVYPTKLVIGPPSGEDREININALTPEQKKIVFGAAEKYVDTNWRAIEGHILDKLGDAARWNEPDYDDKD